MNNESANRRKYIRVGSTLLIKYRVLDSKDFHEESVTHNISGGGVKIPFKEKPQAGAILELELELLKEQKKIALKGKIVWIKSQPKNTGYPYEVGVEILDIASNVRTKLSNYVQYLSRHDLLREAGREGGTGGSNQD